MTHHARETPARFGGAWAERLQWLGCFGAVAMLVHGAACKKGSEDGSPKASASTSAATPALVADTGPPPLEIPSDLNVVLISIDCLRADMPWSGYPRPIAPRLTALAKRAVRYSHAYSISSYTSMSVGGLLAGAYPSSLERDGYFFGTYAPKNEFFPEILQAHGVHTMGAHAHGYFKKGGLDQGFARWELVPELKWNNTTDENITSPELEQLAERLLSEPAAKRKRFFAWFHFVDPHDLYLPHEGIGPYGEKLRDKYDAEVTFTDRYIGKLLDFIDSRPFGKNTAFIVTSDHGEAFGEHGQFRHGFEVWENLVRVPLFLVIPGVAPRVIDTPRSAIDIAPTILELFGQKTPEQMRGKSLVGDLRAEKPEERDIIIDLPQTSDNDKRRALVRGHLKVIASGTIERLSVFDIAADPGEEKPLSRGEATKGVEEAYHAASKSIEEVSATRCREDCLNGAYHRKEKHDD